MQTKVLKIKMEEIISMHSGVEDRTLNELKSINRLSIKQSTAIDALLDQLLFIDLSKTRRNKILIEVRTLLFPVGNKIIC